MGKHAIIAVKLLVICTILLGVIYPLAVTGLAQLIFPRQARGSMIVRDGQVIGSQLIGQQFTRPEYFHPRPSAAGTGYDAMASGGSNLGPTSRKLTENVKANVRTVLAENPGLKIGKIPIDMVTTSASGLDPDISPANAFAQAKRIAVARSIPTARVRALIERNVTRRQFGILGEPRVNVLQLNLALDEAGGMEKELFPQ